MTATIERLEIYRVKAVKETEIEYPLNECVTRAADIAAIMRRLTDGDMTESLWGFYLNTKNHIIAAICISQGTLNQSVAHPREIFRPAILFPCSGLILAHNHPSGDPTPSNDDRKIIQRLLKCGQDLGIRLLDHVIVGDTSHFSFADDGVLDT